MTRTSTITKRRRPLRTNRESEIVPPLDRDGGQKPVLSRPLDRCGSLRSLSVLRRVAAPVHHGFVLRLKQNPENESVRDQQ